MKIILFTGAGILIAAAVAGLVFLRGALASGSSAPTAAVPGALWDFKTRTLEGEDVDLSRYAGRVALVVNVASKCGLTPQYEGLEALYRARREAGLVILAFPSNDFLGQEPGTPVEIRDFCTTNFAVSFPLLVKVKVKGEDRDEIYRWLTAGGLEAPTWNFTKYLVGRDGAVIARFAPRTAPDDPELTRAIDVALAAPAP